MCPDERSTRALRWEASHRSGEQTVGVSVLTVVYAYWSSVIPDTEGLPELEGVDVDIDLVGTSEDLEGEVATGPA